MSFKIVPSEEGGDQEQAMLAHNLQFVEISKVASRLNDIPEDQLGSIFGRVAGGMDVRLRKSANNLGVTLSSVKTAENLEQILSVYDTKLSELNKSIEDLNQNREEATKVEVAALKQKITDLESLNEKLSNDYNHVSTEKEKIATEFSQKQIEMQISNLIAKAESKFIIVEDENTRIAVNAEKNYEHKWTLDEQGNQIVYDVNGKAILSSKGTGFADYEEVMNAILTRRNAHKKHTGGGGAEKLPINEDIPQIVGRNPAYKK